ncbi:helix-turn-helix domain-containing protein [Corynebacterium vitaeruminis]|uniref:helix-turn-helix domain-containing protein n=1 Tax=Corynebacterium vitaeruminis TaxID=38305 RepID=UPI0009DD5360|nr:helix-turn-helix domain-containing protein [Corynebacterium vitaeruminis]
MTYSAADRERALALVINDHLSLKDAEKQSGIGRARIRRWLKELGICLVPRFGGTVDHYLEVRQQAMKLLGQGVSVAEVARSCSVSVSVVRLWCKDSGMTIAQFRAQAAADQREKELALLVDELPQQTECAKVGRGRRLSNLQRRIIELADANGYNLASIASLADTSASTVSRELKRGACDYAAYSALRGHEHAQHCAKRPRPRKLHVNQRLRHEVVSRLNLGQSPRLISKILSRDFSNDEQMSISHETRECLMVCVWVPNLHKEMDQNDYCGETRSG